MKKCKKILVVLLALCMAVSLCACGNSDTQTQSDSVDSQTTETGGLAIVVKNDGTVKLATDAPVGINAESVMAIQGVEIPENVDTTTLTYSSSDPSIATVDALGHVTPVGEGSCTITVKGKTVTVSSDDAEGMCAKGDMVVSNADVQSTGEMGFSFMANEPVTYWCTSFGVVAVKHIETSEGEGEDTIVAFGNTPICVDDNGIARLTEEQKAEILEEINKFIEKVEAAKAEETVDADDTVEVVEGSLAIDDTVVASVAVNPTASVSKAPSTAGTSSGTTTPKVEKIVKGVLEYEGDIVRNTETGVTVDISKVAENIKKLYSNERYATYLTSGYTEAATGTKHVVVNGVEYAGTGVNPWKSDEEFMAEVGDTYANDYDSACDAVKCKTSILNKDDGFIASAVASDLANQRYYYNDLGLYSKLLTASETWYYYYYDTNGEKVMITNDGTKTREDVQALSPNGLAYTYLDYHLYETATGKEIDVYDINAPVVGNWDRLRWKALEYESPILDICEATEMESKVKTAEAAVAEAKAERAAARGDENAEELAKAAETAKIAAEVAKADLKDAQERVEKYTHDNTDIFATVEEAAERGEIRDEIGDDVYPNLSWAEKEARYYAEFKGYNSYDEFAADRFGYTPDSSVDVVPSQQTSNTEAPTEGSAETGSSESTTPAEENITG